MNTITTQTKRLVVAGYIDGPWQRIEVDPIFGDAELWDHDMADFVSIDPFDAPATCSFFAHLMPVDGELQRCIDEAQAIDSAYVLGQDDHHAGRYLPPFAQDEHAAYIKGQNDAWAMANNVKWWRKS